jgi:hypothetical protein
VLLNPAVLVVSGLSDVLRAIGRILLSYLVHMHSSLRSLRQGQVHVGPITWEVLPQQISSVVMLQGKLPVYKYPYVVKHHLEWLFGDSLSVDSLHLSRLRSSLVLPVILFLL